MESSLNLVSQIRRSMRCGVRILFLNRLVLLFCLLTGLSQEVLSQKSWAEVLRARKGSITVHWYESRPFIYTNPQGQMAGIELEVILGLKKFLKDKHGVDLTVNWKKAQSFSGLYETISEGKQH